MVNLGIAIGTQRDRQLTQVAVSVTGRWPDDRADPDTRVGIMILTHELAHLVGHRNEAETECVAMWAVGCAAVAFGGSTADGVATANWYAANHNPLLRPDYHAPGCLTGGRLSSPIVNGR